MIVYTSPHCINCKKLKNTLDENKIDYKEVNIFELSDKEIHDVSNKANSLNLPIIQINEDYYSYEKFKGL